MCYNSFSEVDKRIGGCGMSEEYTSLAMAIMSELKKSAKRWFIAFCVMTVLEIATIIGFVWYISLPVEETSAEQNIDDVNDNNDIRQIIGDDN